MKITELIGEAVIAGRTVARTNAGHVDVYGRGFVVRRYNDGALMYSRQGSEMYTPCTVAGAVVLLGLDSKGK